MYSLTLFCAATLLATGCGPNADKSVGQTLNNGQQADAASRGENNDAAPTAKEHHYFHKTEKPHAAEWTYTGETGPSHWGDLSPKYVLAKDGKQQSPIDLVNPEDEELPQLELNYRPSKIDLVYNGHTIEETEEAGSTLRVDGKSFALKQFHFHAPSEHTIDGKHAAMEMHLVHLDEAGRIAVVGVMIEEGAENQAINPVWDYLPTEVNKKVEFGATVDASALLPEKLGYFHYMGSLTTPPCSQEVNWYVLAEPIELSAQQIEKFTAIINHNNRPVQPLNGRTIVRSAR